MQITKKKGKLLCRHKFPRGVGQFVFLGDQLESNRLYFYQISCAKCGKVVRLIGTAEEIVAWRHEHEK